MSDDIVDELRQFHHDEAADEILRLRAVLDAIDALHQPVPCDSFDVDWMCGCCLAEFPCPTARLLHPAPEEANDALGTVHK
jgi:hypothetical protein